MCLGGDTREGEQVVDQVLHPDRRALHPLQVVAPLLAQNLSILRLEAIAKGPNLTQRLLQVVGGYVGKVLKLTIALVQFRGVCLQVFLDPLAFSYVPGNPHNRVFQHR